METLNDERINELGHGIATYAYEELITKDERQEYIDDESRIQNLICSNSEDGIRYLSDENWFHEEYEMNLVEDNIDDVVDDIIDEAVSELQMMLEDDM